MLLRPNQMYLESHELYQWIRRLAQVRLQRAALAVEHDQLERQIRTAMTPDTEIVDPAFIRTQTEATSRERREMFVARIDATGQLIVHPAYVSEHFRDEAKTPISSRKTTIEEMDISDEEMDTTQAEEMDTTIEEMDTTQAEETDTTQAEEMDTTIEEMDISDEEMDTTQTKENEEERESALPPAPPSLKEKEEERERPLLLPPHQDREAKDGLQDEANDDDDIRSDAPWKVDPAGFINFFNSTMTAAHASIPLITVMKGKRLEAANARSREYGKEAVIQVIRNAATSEFLNGGGNSGWVASVDWLLRPNNFYKALEGQYRNRQKKMTDDERRRRNREIEEEIRAEQQRQRDEMAAGAATIEQLREIFGDDFGR